MSIVSEEQVIKVMHKYNPWWSTTHAIKDLVMPQKRMAYYEALNITTHDSIRRFVVLSGARRVGKTTIMYQMIENLINSGIKPQNILYLSFDNPIVKLNSVETIMELYDSFYVVEGTKYIFFDEIQYTDNWELWMKIIYDTRKDIRLVATGSASPLLEKGATDSGTGRWSVLKIPTMSFYEYCKLLQLEVPELEDSISIFDLEKMEKNELLNLTAKFTSLVNHLNRYLTVGGFPELVLSKDDTYAQRMLREDVVDKVLKRDVLTIFNVRNPLLIEKLFLYLCLNSTEIFSVGTVAKELDNISNVTIENYIEALEMSNLIYVSKPTSVGSKGTLKGKPKIYIADAAIKNAVLMIEDILSDEKELGSMMETTVYKHISSYIQGMTANIGYFRKIKDNQKEVDVVVELPTQKILFEVKYRNNSHIPNNDAIVELCNQEESKISHAFVVTKKIDDIGVTKHDSKVPIFRIPAVVFLYVLGKMEENNKLR